MQSEFTHYQYFCRYPVCNTELAHKSQHLIEYLGIHKFSLKVIVTLNHCSQLNILSIVNGTFGTSVIYGVRTLLLG